MIFQAKNYATRQALEDAISKEVGLNMEENRLAGHTIEGLRNELKRLYLSDLTVVHGVRCIITDFPTDTLPKSPSSVKPIRGEKHKFGIVGK